MTLAKCLHLFKKYPKACNIKFPPLHKNVTEKTKKTPQKNRQNHLFLSVEDNNTYIRFKDK